MTDIPNTEYITVNKDGIFVGNEPATEYRGIKISCPEYVREYFQWMQKANPNIVEFHVMSSRTKGEYAEIGNPSAKQGRYAWCRIKSKDGFVGSWVFYTVYGSSAGCASYCAYYCGRGVRGDSFFRSAVFGSVAPQSVANKENNDTPNKNIVVSGTKIGAERMVEFPELGVRLKIVVEQMQKVKGK